MMRNTLSSLCFNLKWLLCVMGSLKGKVFFSCVVGGLEIVCSLGFVMASKHMIDVVTGVCKGSFMGIIGVMLFLVVVRLAFAAAGDWLSGMLPFEMKTSLRNRFHEHLLRCRWLEMEQYHTGDLLYRTNRDTDDVARFASVILPDVVIVSLQFLMSFVYLCMLDPVLSWWLLVIIAVCFVGGRLYVGRMHRYVRAVRKEDSRVQSTMQEDLQHHVLIKALGRVSERMGIFQKLQAGLKCHVAKRVRLSVCSRMMAFAGFAGGYLLVFAWGGYRLSEGEISFGLMVASLQLVGYIQRPAFDLVSLAPSFVTAYTAVERLQELEKLPEEECGSSLMVPEAPSIQFEDVSFSYSDGRKVFDRFTATIPAGRFTVVSGESGIGKTTLVRLLLALMPPASGSISLCGAFGKVPVSPLARANFVYVPQGSALFSGTVRENLRFGNPQATDAEMLEALRVAEAGFVFEWKEGLDTVLTEAGGGLSEGQMQRMAIARTLLHPAWIWIFDEATSALDADTERKVVANLRAYCSGRTVVFVTHHVGVVDACDGVIRL